MGTVMGTIIILIYIIFYICSHSTPLFYNSHARIINLIIVLSMSHHRKKFSQGVYIFATSVGTIVNVAIPLDNHKVTEPLTVPIVGGYRGKIGD